MMPLENFTLVALPHSVATSAKFHVSLFISPQLTPDVDEGLLKEFSHFLHWGKLIKTDATLELFDQIGPIASKPRLDPVSPDFWDAVFPPDTPVRVPRDLDFGDRRWRTFRASETHDGAKLLHLMGMVSDPTSPPLPSLHPLRRFLAEYGRGQTGYDESIVTERFDEAIGEFGELGEVVFSLRELEARVDAEENLINRLFIQLHRARRFYERPESKLEYRERPEEGATSLRPARPEPDFHERCSLVADHPSLQRRLGLVIDLVVDDPDRLRDSRWLSARIEPAQDAAACRPTRTRCGVDGEDLVTIPGTEDWSAERLRLGDSELFALLDMDPDGSSIKLDRFLWTLPRLLEIEENGDPIHAAPTALRSLGFTVVRNKKALETQNRIERQQSLRTAVGDDDSPLLNTEDVTQGMRVEVWDDVAGAWFTLHARRIDAEVLDHGTIVDGLFEEGYIQGTTATEIPDVEDSPVHVHESVFGWEGWSLSASRPGKRVRHEDGDEEIEDQDADPDPVTPLIVKSEVEAGTLPRLRYGRSYAFRAWGVNLAGNSRPHEVGPTPPPPDPAVAGASSALAGAPAPPPGSLYIPTLRSETAAEILRRRMTVVDKPRDVPEADLTLLADPDVQRAVVGHLRTRRAELETRERTRPDVTADRASIVGRAFHDAIVDQTRPFISDTALRDPQVVARAAMLPGVAPDAVGELIDFITPLRPFLRWDPVQPPAVVTRHRFSSGESLRQLVIRSGVTQDMETLEITVQPPDEYAAAHAAFGYRSASERHLVPPKTSQSEAELHGAFDGAIGSTDPSDHTRLLAVALREAGTLFDLDVPRLDDPSVRDPQPGIDLVADPTAPPSTLKSLPLLPEEMPAPGQYVAHDTDALVLPYLPDVLGRGISLVFHEAGRDRIIPFPFGSEGFTARYLGEWPERRPFRFVLYGSEVLSGDLDEHVLRIGLPAGDIQRFRLASSLGRDDLELFGPWRFLPEVIRTNNDVVEAAADGWLWALTPFDEVTLVHAVARPLEAPRPTVVHALRPGSDATDVVFLGAVDVHGPSTEMITAEATWTDPVDDLSLPAPDEGTTQAIAFTTMIRETEDLAVLYGGATDVELNVPGAGPVWFHSAIQKLGDTRHHRIRYRFRAATRFREYFDPETLTPTEEPVPGGPIDDGQSVVGPEVEVSVPSSARPAAPIVHSVLPLFIWDAGTEPEQPVAKRHRRRAGLRIYLERPWFSSGEGELLGVLLAPGGSDAGALRHPVSQWGADPVWVGAPVANRALFLELDNLLRAVGLEDRPGDALPVVPPATLPLTTIPGSPEVTVLGYRPQFSADRGMRYVDVAIDPGSTFWPFVRLAVARYQPDSIAGAHLSKPVACDFVQLTPDRTPRISRTDVNHVRVVVSGPIGIRERPPGRRTPAGTIPEAIEEYGEWVRMHRKVVARLQRRDPLLDTDLGWETVTAAELTVRGFGRNIFEAAWVGELGAPEDITLRTPGENPDWRVTVEEWERLPGDPEDLAKPGPPVWEQRLIYADEVML